MSYSYTYIVADDTGKGSRAIQYKGVETAPKDKIVPSPGKTAKLAASGRTMEAWGAIQTSSDDTVEGGLYKCTLDPPESANIKGGSHTIYWMIDSDGRSKAANTVAGHATIVMAGRATVVPVWAADGKVMGSGTRIYYFQNS